MHRINRTTLLGIIISVLLPIPVSWSETIYDKPYMADFPWQPPTQEIKEFIQHSDVIFVGISETLDGSYQGRIKPLEIFKGKLDAATVKLSWQPSATGLASGSRHLFFVKKKGTEWEVIKEMYIHNNPYDAIRAYGAMDGGREATLSVVKYLSGQHVPSNQLSELLLTEAKHEHNQRRETALLLAIELSDSASIPALQYAAEQEGDARAIYALVRLDGPRGTECALKYLIDHPECRRDQQAPIFAALARAGNSQVVTALSEFGSAHPEFQVSCAFVMAQLGAEKGISTITQWQHAPDAKMNTERVSTGWQTDDIPRAELLQKALAMFGNGPDN